MRGFSLQASAQPHSQDLFLSQGKGPGNEVGFGTLLSIKDLNFYMYSHFPKEAATDEEQEHSNYEDTKGYSC